MEDVRPRGVGDPGPEVAEEQARERLKPEVDETRVEPDQAARVPETTEDLSRPTLKWEEDVHCLCRD